MAKGNRAAHLCWAVSVLVTMVLKQAQAHRNPYNMSDYKNHPCKRPCKEGATPMTCKYYFLVEHYTTLSAGCYGCPSTLSHCDLPQCVTGNGIVRPILTVNRAMPGPAIHVCKGDTVEVTVDNRMELGEGTTIHWHGVTQKGTPFMDGTSMITQCPITKWSRMTYRFLADDAGTNFWHSHAALQRSDGLFGGLVIREPPSYDIHGHLFDADLPEHTILLNDWSKDLSVKSVTSLFTENRSDKPNGILVNGKGRAPGGLEIPRTEFLVKPGMRYRFRVIFSGITNCPVYIRVDGHSLVLISSDGRDFEPVKVDSFTIFSGERYDFILETKQYDDKPKDSYWMRFKGLSSCKSNKIIETAVLRYNDRSTSEPKVQVTYDDTIEEEGETTFNDLSGISTNKSLQITDLKSVGTYNISDLEDKPDKRFYISLVSSALPDERFMVPPNPDCVKSKQIQSSEVEANETNAETGEELKGSKDDCKRLEHHNLQLNYITGRLPPAPPLTQYDDIPEKLMCNDDNMKKYNCSARHCQCVHTLSVANGDLVELVLVSPDTPDSRAHLSGKLEQLIHPMHIHGHAAAVVTMLRITDDVSVEKVKAMDARGEIKRLRARAPMKDTIPVGDQSVVILRFRADNPGFWFFHCHIELHTELGMALVIQSGNVGDMPKPSNPLPKCYSWSPRHGPNSKGIFWPAWANQMMAGDDRSKSHKMNTTEIKDIEESHTVSQHEPPSSVDPLTQSSVEGIAVTPTNKTQPDFITANGVLVLMGTVLVCVAAPTIVIGVLILVRRWRQGKQPYRLIEYTRGSGKNNKLSMSYRSVDGGRTS